MTRPTNPEMLKLARESRGLTQNELAVALQITQGKVSKYESGLLRIPDELLHLIGQVLGYPEDFFSFTDGVYGPGSNCNYHRKRVSLPVQELRTILAIVNVVRIQLSKLLPGVDIHCENRFYRFDLDEETDSPEHIAGLIRRSWQLPLGPVNDLTAAIESAGGIVFMLSFNTRKLDAVSQWVPGLPPMFFVNQHIPADRLRFTLAHELGHLVMHQTPTQDLEREADRFAAEFLMPEREIRPQLSSLSLGRLAELKQHWKVSMAALTKRAFDLGRITSAQYRKLFTQIGKSGYRLAEPVPIAPEHPAIVNDLIDVYRKNHGYTTEEICRQAGSLEDEFLSRFQPTKPRFQIVG